jgi:hypothetical protein
MSIRPLVPSAEPLRRAVAWLLDQGDWSPQRIQEACQRFDISPVDEEFLLAECRRVREQGQQ